MFNISDSICDGADGAADGSDNFTYGSADSETLTQSGAPGRVIGWTNFSH